MINIPNHLSRKLKINLNQRVTEIHYHPGEVEVRTPTNTFSGDAVIVTVPIGVLLQDRNGIAFDPPLPRACRNAMAMIHMGVLNKIILRFKAFFWRQDVPLFIATPDSSTLCTWFLNLGYTGHPLLMGFVGGNNAREIESMPDSLVRTGVLKDLHRIFGASAKIELEDIEVTRWGRDPFALGSYSRFRAGATGHERKLLMQPILGKLFFAGEATHPSDPSTIHGAYWSGQRAADQISGYC